MATNVLASSSIALRGGAWRAFGYGYYFTAWAGTD